LGTYGVINTGMTAP